MATLRDWKSNNVRAYYLQHPDATISQAAKAIGVSQRTAAQVRTELVAKGHLQPGRNAKPRNTQFHDMPLPPDMLPPEPGAAPSPPTGGDTLLTDEVLRSMAGKPDSLLDDLDTLDDEETRKKLLREVKRIAFAPDSHPDVRLSATQVWLKLKDMAKSRELGPGKPLTRAAAISRLKDLHLAVTAEIALAACIEAFGAAAIVQVLYRSLGMETPPNAPKDDEATSAVGPPQETLPPGHEGAAQETDDLRPVHMDGGHPPGDETPGDHPTNDLPRPEA
jgi:hypothetical protein